MKLLLSVVISQLDHTPQDAVESGDGHSIKESPLKRRHASARDQECKHRSTDPE